MQKPCSAKVRLVSSFIDELVNKVSWYHLLITCTFITTNLVTYQAHMALNDIDAAVENFKKALDLEPNDGES